MAHLYGGFQEEDQIEQENDADIGALGSILSWDEEEQDDSGDEDNNSRGRVSAGAAAAPPDMVQFSMKDGVPQFSFLPGPGGTAGLLPPSLQQQQLSQSSSDQLAGLTMRLPMPTPISTMQSSSVAAAVASNAPSASAQQRTISMAPAPTLPSAPPPPAAPEPEQQNSVQQSQQNALAATFAQFLAQQTGALLQQQQQQQQGQPQNVPTQPSVQSPGLSQQQQQQMNDMNAQQMMQQLFQANQQAAGAVQQQQTPQQQLQQTAQSQANLPLPFTADPNAFLQQLQLAQLQQQLQLAQQQQSQVPSQPTQTGQRKRQAPSNASTGTQQLVPQSRAPLPIAPTVSRPTVQAPPAKKAKTAKASKPPPTASSQKDGKPKARNAKVGVVSASDTDGEGSKQKKKKAVQDESIALLDDDANSTEDRVQANRDRNREHARNTRLRKKAYLEKLKATVDELCKERDTLVSERAGAANLLVEMHNTRTEVLMSFFALRSTNEKRRKLWSSILDESCFSCVMPVTPYRSFPASEVQVSKCQRTILGIDAMMADTASLHVLFSSLVDRSQFPKGKVEFRYTLVTEESVVAGNQMMARWVMSTTNATELGARMEVAKQGMLCCKFNSSHRIIGLELMFDVMAFMLQLKQAAGSDNFPVIPNTVQTCQRLFDKPMVLTLAEPPYTIVQVNKLWEDMTGYSAEEVVGKLSCRILQGPKTDREAVDELMQEVRFKRPCSTLLTNVKKSGETFRQFLVVFPLSTDSRITHYLALSTPNVGGDVDSDKVAPTTQTQPIPANSLKQPPTAFMSQAVLPGSQLQQPQMQQAQLLPQNNSVLPSLLMNNTPNPSMLPAQPTSLTNFSTKMAPPPSRK